MAGRNSKTIHAIEKENITHLTKEEIKQRKIAEAATLTGKPMAIPRWLSEEEKKEFKKLRELFVLIKKNDAIYTNILARYCQLKVECEEYEEMIEECRQSRLELKSEYHSGSIDENDMSASTYYRLLNSMQKNIVSLDKQIMSKRSMMLSIEKECAMTVAASLRSIPKKVEKKPAKSGIAKFTSRAPG